MHKLVFILLPSLALVIAEDVVHDQQPLAYQKLKCYACTSYVPYCRKTVNETGGGVPHVGCRTKCFLRQGDEGATAIYRGCADDFKGIGRSLDFDGCKYIDWNGKKRLWCLCSNDFCNGESPDIIKGLGDEHHRDSYEGDYASPIDNTIIEKQKKRRYYRVKSDNDYIKNNYKLQDLDDAANYAKEVKVKPAKEQAYDDKVYDNKKHETRVTDAGIDRPFLKEKKKVYTDIEQVHYGQSNDIFVKPGKQRSGTKDPYEVYNYNDNYGQYEELDGNFVQQPYYPYTEGKDQAFPTQPYLSKKKTQQPSYKNQYGKPEEYTISKQQPKETLIKQSDYRPQELTIKEEVVEVQDTKEKLLCTRTGFIPNPDDCSKFLACIMDPNIGKPVMHPMKCPEGLFWDNKVRICVPHSTTCRLKEVIIEEMAGYPEDHSYTQGSIQGAVEKKKKLHEDVY